VPEVIDVRCEHCGKVPRIDPNGTTDLKLEFIGTHHKLQFLSESQAEPIIIDNGGITDLPEAQSD